MELNEIRAAAKEYGYRLKKIEQKVHVKPCPHCGKTSIYGIGHVDTGTDKKEHFYYCRSCGFKAKPSTAMVQARRNWNEGKEYA